MNDDRLTGSRSRHRAEAEPRADDSTLRLLGQVIGGAVESAMLRAAHRNPKENVAIFVDYDNVFWTLMNRYRHDPDHEDANRNLFDRLWNFYGMDNIRMFKAYADFEQVDANLTSLQKKRVQIRHVYANGKNEDKAKNASDIELSIDAMESSYSDPHISCYVFVTADSDMIPIMSRMLYRGKTVELFYVEDAIAKHTDIRNYAHESYDLLQFLHVDVSPKNPADFLEDAITYISEWHAQPANKTKNLGPKWLRDGLADYLSIPSNTASQVIDLLHRNNLIREELRTNEYGTHKNIVLNLDPDAHMTASGVSGGHHSTG
jgi:hypothetical protein